MADGVRSSPSWGGWKAGLASAEFRLASPQMARAPVLRSSATAEGGEARELHFFVTNQISFSVDFKWRGE